MFTPKYRITEYFLSLTEKIVQLQTRISDSNIQFAQLKKLQQQAMSLTVKSSTTIEGNVLSLEQVQALAEKKDIAAEFSQKQEVLNYFNALDWVLMNYSKQITEERILFLHRIICDKLIREESLGGYKQKQNYIINENNIVTYTPPSPEQTKWMVKELLDWLNEDNNRNPIIESAIFHHWFVSIHPFSDGNGRMARLLSQWILYKNKFDAKHIYYLDTFYSNDRDRYYQKIIQTRELDYDFTYWLDYVAEGLVSTINEVYDKVLQLNHKSKILLNDKQQQLLELLRYEGRVNTAYLQDALKVNRARINQLISPLIKAGIVAVEGKARATKYILK
ncbi:MAG: Fic family protein [Candidatus Riflemargulisbacteria bacterium]